MNFHIVTIFPDFIKSYCSYGVLSRAIERKLINVFTYNPRDYAGDKRKTIDDRVYGGGKGMLFLAPLLHRVVQDIKAKFGDGKVVYLTPRGKVFRNNIAKDFSKEKNLILIAARYEGVDERFVEADVDEEISIGDYVLTGGELPALVVLDVVSRFVGGFLDDAATGSESFEKGLLEYSHYTRPEKWEGLEIPEVLKSGNHKKIEAYRCYDSLKKTYFNRPDLFFNYIIEKQNAGENQASLKSLRKTNEKLRNFLLDIQKIAEEWKNVRRNSTAGS